MSLIRPSIFSGIDEAMSFAFPSAMDLITNPTPFIVRDTTGDTATLRRSSPFYEITEDDDQFQLVIDLPGVKASDVKCDVEDNNQVLRVSGGRTIKLGKGKPSKTRFEKTFTIDKSVDAKAISANLHDGVLIVTAPKDKKFKESHQIAVTQKPHQIEVGTM